MEGFHVRVGWAAWGMMVSLLASAGAARAADEAKPSSLQLNAVALPVVVDGQLVNYVFVTVKLDLALGADAQPVRNKEAFFRDALVRAGHRSPFTLAADYTKLDPGRIRAAVLNAAVGIVGPGVVANVEVVKQVSERRSAQRPRQSAVVAQPPATSREPELIP